MKTKKYLAHNEPTIVRVDQTWEIKNDYELDLKNKLYVFITTTRQELN